MSVLIIADAASYIQGHMEQWVAMRRGMQPNGYEYTCLEDFVLRHGCAWEPRKTPAPVPMGVPGHCFYNALRAARRRKRWRYVEGYACTTIGFPVHHAWNLDADGALVDLTWGHAGAGLDPAGYVGVIIPADIGALALKAAGQYSVLADAKNRYPLLQQPYTEEGARAILTAIIESRRRTRIT